MASKRTPVEKVTLIPHRREVHNMLQLDPSTDMNPVNDTETIRDTALAEGKCVGYEITPVMCGVLLIISPQKLRRPHTSQSQSRFERCSSFRYQNVCETDRERLTEWAGLHL